MIKFKNKIWLMGIQIEFSLKLYQVEFTRRSRDTRFKVKLRHNLKTN
jgi:hypothetical protein